MAKKNTWEFNVEIKQNLEQGGGWLARYIHINTTSESPIGAENTTETTAWKNASAAKRWIKAKVQEKTPRKSVKLEPISTPNVEKPTGFSGGLSYKA